MTAAVAALATALVAACGGVGPRPAAAVATPVSVDSAGAAIRAGSWTYAARIVGDGRSAPAGTRTVSLVPAAEAAGEAWLLLDSQRGGPATVVDSLVLAADTFRPLRRAMHLAGPRGDVSLALRFDADSVHGELRTGSGVEPLAMPNVRGAVAADAVVLVTLAALPLVEGWSGALPVLDPQRHGTVLLQLVVTGAERVSVPAGRFDTWVVAASSGGRRAVYYVARNGPVVKVVAGLPNDDAAIESVLQSARGTP